MRGPTPLACGNASAEPRSKPVLDRVGSEVKEHRQLTDRALATVTSVENAGPQIQAVGPSHDDLHAYVLRGPYSGRSGFAVVVRFRSRANEVVRFGAKLVNTRDGVEDVRERREGWREER